jgi:hypothetical protein
MTTKQVPTTTPKRSRLLRQASLEQAVDAILTKYGITSADLQRVNEAVARGECAIYSPPVIKKPGMMMLER